MAGVFIDIPGIGNVEAKTAATEATLREILKALKGGGGPGGTGGPGGPGGGGGGGPGGGGGGAGALVGKAFGLLGKGVGKATGAIGSMTDAVGFAGAKATKFGEAVIGAVDQLANLSNTASGVAGIFGGIPLVGPAFKAVAGAADSVVASFNAVSQSGASFGGSISNFAKSASEAGMSMEQFGQLVKSNGQGMLGFGGTVEDGAKNFAKVSKQVRATGSDLYALGFSTQEINSGLANYGALLRQQGLQGKKSNEDLAKGAKSYLKEMDALAKITGEERSAKEAQAKQLAADAQFQAAMAGMNEEVRSSFRDTVLGLPGPLQNFTKDMLANGVATTEENQKLMAMMPQSAAMMQKLNAKMQKGEQVTMEERNALNNLMKEEGGKNLKNIKQAGAASGELAGVVNGLAATQQINSNAVKEASAEQKKAAAETDKMNQKMQDFQARIAEVGNNFKMLLANSGILDALIQAFDIITKLANQYLVPAFNIVVSAVMKVWNGFQMLLSPVLDYISEKFGAKGLGGTLDWVDGIMNTVFDALGGVVRGAILAFDGFWDGIQPVIGALGRLWDSLFGTSDMTSSFGDVMIDVGDFLGQAFRVLGDVIGFLIDYGVRPLAWTIKTFMIDPLIWVGKVIGDVIGFFINFKDNMAALGEVLDEFLDNILRLLNKVTFGAAGISEEEKARRDALRSDAKALRDAEKEKIKTADQHKAELKEDKKKFAETKLTSDKVTGLAKKEAAAKEEAVKAQEKANSVDYNSGPEGLLLQHANKEGSALVPKEALPKDSKQEVVKNAETTKKEIEQKGEEKQKAEADKAKAEAEKKAKEEADKKTKEEGEKKKGTQETAETLLAQLNTNMAQLIKINQEQKDIGEKQLSVQRGLSGDLFVAV